jgi:mRNA interferase RelE/StbE
MAWRIEFTRQAEKDLASLDRQTAQRIVDFMLNRVARLPHPRQLGSQLKGNEFAGYWRYRVGDHRVLARIENELVTVFVVEIGHRREIYR